MRPQRKRGALWQSALRRQTGLQTIADAEENRATRSTLTCLVQSRNIMGLSLVTNTKPSVLVGVNTRN